MLSLINDWLIFLSQMNTRYNVHSVQSTKTITQIK